MGDVFTHTTLFSKKTKKNPNCKITDLKKKKKKFKQ